MSAKQYVLSAWWLWYFGPYVLGVVLMGVLMFSFVRWDEANQADRFRAYIAKYHCAETAVETPYGNTFFRYACTNGVRFNLPRSGK